MSSIPFFVPKRHQKTSILSNEQQIYFIFGIVALILKSLKQVLFIVVLLSCIGTRSFLFAQESYNACSNALELCPNNITQVNNIDANVTFCPNCEDDFTPCFSLENSIWLQFTTNTSGGDVTVNFSNLQFETAVNQANALQATIVTMGAPCDGSTYTAIGNCENNQTGSFALNATGLSPNTTYYVLIDGDNSGGLTPAEATFDVAISGTSVDRAIPSGTIAINQNPICLNTSTIISAHLTNCTDTANFQWFVNGTLEATTTTPFWSTSDLVDGDEVSFQTSCFTSCPVEITASSGALSVHSFAIDAGIDQTIAIGGSTNLAGTTTVSNYSWSPTFGVSNPSSLNPLVSPEETTVYTLTGTDTNGCILSDQTTVFVPVSIEIPNGFSPNGDGDNDYWILKGIENYDNVLVSVYTRWGQLIFQENAYKNFEAWDGKSASGKNADEGVYFYVIELNDDAKTVFKGNLTLLR